MKKNVRGFVFVAATLLSVSAFAQGGRLLTPNPAGAAPFHDQLKPESCRGAVSLVTDVGFEGVKTTAHNFSNATGGGESNRFDKTPVLTTKVELRDGCLNAHLSALVGSAQTYGVSPVTLFQVTLTPTWILVPPTRHMYGHYETPYGIYGPAVAIEAEGDVDELSANFFQRVGTDPTAIPPGTYEVNVWWAGGPTAPGGAIGAAFVLKLYQ
ncbi:MAG TPA: hypothetical protein VF266_22150 [Thermoanaerobaculia bacterium]